MKIKKEMTPIVIIPARYASTRFPGKPLAVLNGKTVIERVYTQAQQACEQVVVATDDERIFNEVTRFGGKAVITSKDHQSGTDRIAEAYRLIGSKADIVVNVQGDEPFIKPEQIQQLIACFNNPQTDIATLAHPIGYDEADNPNWVKVVMTKTGKALYFSRSIIPYRREPQPVQPSSYMASQRYFRHLGIYAYRSQVLQQITSLKPAMLEQTEKLEQLRWLENDYTIRVAVTDTASIGIDTPEDLEKALQLWNHTI